MSRRKQSHPKSWKDPTPDKNPSESKPKSQEPHPPSSTVASVDSLTMRTVSPLDYPSRAITPVMSPSDMSDSREQASLVDTSDCILPGIKEGDVIGPIPAELVLKESSSSIDVRHQFEIGSCTGEVYIIHPMPSRLHQMLGQKMNFIAAKDKIEADILVFSNDEEGLFFKVQGEVTKQTDCKMFYVGRQDDEVKKEPEEPESLTTSPDSTLDPTAIFKCQACEVSFRNYNNLAAHQEYYCKGRVETDTRDAPSLKDLKCASSSLSKSINGGGRSSPVKAHEETVVHVCQLCQSSFMARQNCESHMLILHCSKHIPMCKFCNFVGKSWAVLREHVFCHVKIEKRRVETSAPDGEYDDKNSLKEVRCDTTSGQRKKPWTDQVVPPELEIHRVPSTSSCRSPHVTPTDRYTEDHCHRNHNAGCSAVSKYQEKDKVAIDQENCLDSGCYNSQVERKEIRCHFNSECAAEVDKRPNGFRVVDRKSPLGECLRNRCSKPSSPEKTVPHFTCTDCNINFRSKSTYEAHKQFYCKGRHASRMERGYNRVSSPRMQVEVENSQRRESVRSSNETMDPEAVSSEFIPTRESSVSAPMVYVNPGAPSAMLVGAAPIITPSGAHYLSPIYVLAPPVPIQLAAPCSPPSPRQSASPTVNSKVQVHEKPESHALRNGQEKSKSRADRPLDLRVKSPRECGNVEGEEGAEQDYDKSERKACKRDLDTSSDEDSCSKVQKWGEDNTRLHRSATASFYCSDCDISFRKAKTLMAHKQFYCSQRRRPDKELYGDGPTSEVAVVQNSPQFDQDGDRMRDRHLNSCQNSSKCHTPAQSPLLTQSPSEDLGCKPSSRTTQSISPGDEKPYLSHETASSSPTNPELGVVATLRSTNSPTPPTVTEPEQVLTTGRIHMKEHSTYGKCPPNRTKRINVLAYKHPTRPHICKFCGISFGKLDSLEVHQRFYCHNHDEAKRGHVCVSKRSICNDRIVRLPLVGNSEFDQLRLRGCPYFIYDRPSSNNRMHPQEEQYQQQEDSTKPSGSSPEISFAVRVKREKFDEDTSDSHSEEEHRSCSLSVAANKLDGSLCNGDKVEKAETEVCASGGNIKIKHEKKGILENNPGDCVKIGVNESDITPEKNGRLFQKHSIKQEPGVTCNISNHCQNDDMGRSEKGNTDTTDSGIDRRDRRTEGIQEFVENVTKGSEVRGGSIENGRSFLSEVGCVLGKRSDPSNGTCDVRNTIPSRFNLHTNNGVRTKVSSGSPLAVKTCKYCNIHFRSLSTFIAHKKFYCSSSNQNGKSVV